METSASPYTSILSSACYKDQSMYNVTVSRKIYEDLSHTTHHVIIISKPVWQKKKVHHDPIKHAFLSEQFMARGVEVHEVVLKSICH